MATTAKHPAPRPFAGWRQQAAAAHQDLEASHHHDTGEHDQAKKHADAAHHHSEHGHSTQPPRISTRTSGAAVLITLLRWSRW